MNQAVHDGKWLDNDDFIAKNKYSIQICIFYKFKHWTDLNESAHLASLFLHAELFLVICHLLFVEIIFPSDKEFSEEFAVLGVAEAIVLPVSLTLLTRLLSFNGFAHWKEENEKVESTQRRCKEMNELWVCKALQSKTSKRLMPNYIESVAMFWLIIYDVENTVIFLLS